VAKEKEKEEEKLSLTTLYPSLNLLPNNQSFKKDSQPSYKAIFGTGEEFWSPETVQKPVGDIEDRVSVAGEQTEEEMDEFNKRVHQDQVDPEDEVQDKNSFFHLGISHW
jgi:hypothetical protein